MSRSFRQPVYTDGYKGSNRRQYFKRCFNHVIRKISPFDDSLVNGKMYRKMNDIYSICDYKFWYDPQPRIYYLGGVRRVVEPQPLWRVNRK